MTHYELFLLLLQNQPFTDRTTVVNNWLTRFKLLFYIRNGVLQVRITKNMTESISMVFTRNLKLLNF